MQELCFGTIPSCFWWTLTTMTTVGYGDCYPITILGKMMAVVTMLCGISVLAMPITVLGSNFEKMVSMYEEDAKQVSTASMSEDGQISELELREFLVAKKQDGTLRKDVDTFVPNLMLKFDVDGKGCLSLDEFQKLQERVCIKKAADPDKEIADLKQMVSQTNAALAAMAKRFDRIEAKLGISPVADV